MEAATASLVISAAAEKKNHSELVSDLASPDAGVREAAADVLVDRHETEAIPELVAELKSPDENVRMKAVGELVELKARQAVPSLIELTNPGMRGVIDTPRLLQVIYAIGGGNGGEDAEAYLYTLESGHPEEEVRRAAHEASAELRSHRALPPAGSSGGRADAR